MTVAIQSQEWRPASILTYVDWLNVILPVNTITTTLRHTPAKDEDFHRDTRAQGHNRGR